MSILKGPKDPVILKKVPIRIWHLKDHLMAILRKRLENSGGDLEKIKDINDLKREFRFENRWFGEESEEEEKKDGEKMTLFRRIIEVPEDKMAHGQAILYEINFDKIHFFCEQSFFIGSTIMLKLIVPKAFGIAAIVVDCRPFDFDSKVISEIKYPYRIVAEFKFTRKGQATLLRQFLTAIDPREHQDVEVEETEVEIPTEPSEEAPPEIEAEEEKESA
ncbi:MAG: hypothetical protein E2O68_07550 [Deltaproteobacteria bacterium]|nr:MAG: hypothetical protein E2O68_07550 [Deltaproteobacteria bacterium]